MGIYTCGLSHQIRVAYAKVDRMKQEIKFITFYKFYITDIMYWIRVFIQYAEEKYQEKNQGVTKKQFVINKIKEIGINVFTDEELSTLIDLTVKEFNLDDWKVKL